MNIDEAFETLRRSIKRAGLSIMGYEQEQRALAALDAIREELSRREPTYDGKTAQEWAIENEKLEAQLERQEAALREVKNRPNQVCENYELCSHVGCRSSYEAFAIADAALSTSQKQTFAEKAVAEGGEGWAGSFYPPGQEEPT